ncbi:MAG: filamentous hemagglutinin N-terminal domain-containing protein, partial [Kiritimatiellae bacterium]|nr:filamentous hemagglutinin N-terminal domain-containing protein [Kiritimatiellia bacterium]
MNNFKAEAITAIMRRRLYAKGMRRTPLFKAITGVLAVNMTFMGMAPVALAGNLPEMTSGYGPGMTVDGNKLTIDSTAGSSFTWDQGFNIGQGYSVEFNGISVAVNKDTSGNLSSIMGSLFSSGAVYILNPNGILFGSSAVVDVQGLVAAAVGSVGKGPEGDFIFSKLGSGNVVNQGKISAGDFAYLVGKSVENSGSISAKEVALAAFGGTGADSLTIASAGNGAKITFNIPEGAIADGSGGEVISKGEIKGSQEGSIDIHNAGVINRAMATPITYNGDDVEINIAGANVEIESAAIGKKVTITGTKSVFIGTTAGDDVEVKATDGNVIVTAYDDLTVYDGAKIEAIKDQSDGGDVSLTAENGTITLGGTITANGGAGELTLNAGTKAIEQTGGTITAGDTTLTGGAITLAQDGNTFGNITVNNGTGDISIKENDSIVIASAAHIGSLALNAGANSISQNGSIQLITSGNYKGNLDLTGGAITLENAENRFNGIVVRNGEGNVSIAEGTDLQVTSIKRTSGNVTLNAGNNKISAWPISDEKADISIGGGTLYLKSNTDWSGIIAAGNIDASGKTLKVERKTENHVADIDVAETITVATLDVDGGAVDAKNIAATTKVDQDGGQITVTETISGNVEQKGASADVTISAKKIEGTLTQESENAGIVTAGNITGAVVQNGGQILKHANAENGKLVFGSTVTQHGGTIATAADNVEIVGKLTQAAGATVNASTLTLGADGNAVAGTVNADAIAGGKTIEVQNGGDVNATEITASTLTVKDGAAVDTKDGTGTLAITGDLVQDGGDIATTAGENVT